MRNDNFVLRTPHSKGFTLIEIIITIVIVSILSGIAAMIILQGVRAYSDEQSRSDVHYQARYAMERMSREIRQIRTAAEIGTITSNPENSLIFTDITGTNIRYSLNGTDLNRTVGGGAPALLSRGVTSLQFSHYDNANLATTVTASVWTIEVFMTDQQGAETLNMRTRVHPRNF